jgi:D-alanyl-D-alanine carboxypeptidase (penicillin-binding protein 5/6)
MNSSRGRVLSGGRRRRRPGPFIGLGAVLIVATAVVAVSLALLRNDHSSSRRSQSATAAGPRAPRVAHTPRVLVPAGGGGADRRYAVDLSKPDLVALRFGKAPRAGLMFDVRTGQVLWRRYPTRRLPVASLTKMMTALLVVERRKPRDRVFITRQAVKTAGSAIGVLPKGKKVQLETLLNGLLLVSGNDAAVALAQHVEGSVQRFVGAMNERATQLGLSCTHFTTPNGLQDRGNYSCPADLAALARADLAHRRIRRIARRDHAVLRFPIKGGHLFLYNNNPLIRAHYPGVTGLKTGYTEKSGRSIVTTVRRGGAELGVVLLHSEDPTSQARRLLRRGFRALRAG